MRLLHTLVTVAGVLGMATWTCAADEGYKKEVVLTGLHNPSGLASRPPSAAELFVAESGAGRVLRVKLSEPQKPETAVEGFPREKFDDGPGYEIGPLGLGFVDRLLLIVGEGGQATGADVVRIYQLPDDGKTLKYDQSKQVLGPLKAGKESATGEGDFFAVASTSAALFVGSQGDDAKGWVLKANVANATASQLRPFIATKLHTGVNAPTALATSKRGDLVVASCGQLSERRDSVLSFYNTTSGKPLLRLDTGLCDIVGLAYGRSGLLYAIDVAWADSGQGGLYRLDMDIREGRQAIKPLKLLSLDRPSAIVIVSDRVAYVSTIGKGGNNDSGQEMGQLVKIEGDF